MGGDVFPHAKLLITLYQQKIKPPNKASSQQEPVMLLLTIKPPKIKPRTGQMVHTPPETTTMEPTKETRHTQTNVSQLAESSTTKSETTTKPSK